MCKQNSTRLMLCMALLPVCAVSAPRGKSSADLTDCVQLTAPGAYVVAQDLPGPGGLLADGSCLSIAVSDVSIDLGGYTIKGTSFGVGTGITDGGTSQRNIVVRNGTIKGFSTAVDLGASFESTVEEVRALDNSENGIKLGAQSVAVKNLAVGNTYGIIVTCPGNAIGNSAWSNSSEDLLRLNPQLCTQSAGLNSFGTSADDITCQTCATLGFLTCGEDCVDEQVDENNCGGCGTSCSAGHVCIGGTCSLSCQAGLTACSGKCVDLLTDEDNCGSCGFLCGSNQRCSSGVCSAVLP